MTEQVLPGQHKHFRLSNHFYNGKLFVQCSFVVTVLSYVAVKISLTFCIGLAFFFYNVFGEYVWSPVSEILRALPPVKEPPPKFWSTSPRPNLKIWLLKRERNLTTNWKSWHNPSLVSLILSLVISNTDAIYNCLLTLS